MNSIWETLYDVLFHPVAILREIGEHKPVGQALLVFAFSVLIPIFAVYAGMQAAGMPAWVSITALGQIMVSFILWVLAAAVLNLIAEILGGRPNALGLFAAMGFAHFPRILVVPCWVIAAFLPGGLRAFLMGSSALVILVWSVVLMVIAVREACSISTAKAILTLAAPILVLLAMIVIAAVFIGTALVHMPPWIW